MVLLFFNEKALHDVCLIRVKEKVDEKRDESLLFNAKWQEKVIFWWDDDIHFVLNQQLSWNFIVLSHWNNSPLVDMSLHRTHYSHSEPTSLCPYSLVLWVEKQQNQFYSLWFDQTGTRTHDLPRSKCACWPLHHRCGSARRGTHVIPMPTVCRKHVHLS